MSFKIYAIIDTHTNVYLNGSLNSFVRMVHALLSENVADLKHYREIARKLCPSSLTWLKTYVRCGQEVKMLSERALQNIRQ